MLVLVTRPAEQAAATARALESLGHEVIVDPVLRIELLPPRSLPITGVGGVLLTSTNAVPALTAEMLRLPVFCVGPATARAARAAGCGDVRKGPGDGAGLAAPVADSLPVGTVLLHLAGEEVRQGLAEGLRARGLVYRREVVYRAVEASDLAAGTVAALAAGRVEAVLFFSPRTAAHWGALLVRRGLQGSVARMAAVCLSEAVADGVRGLGWRCVAVAARRDQTALIDCLEGLG